MPPNDPGHPGGSGTAVMPGGYHSQRQPQGFSDDRYRSTGQPGASYQEGPEERSDSLSGHILSQGQDNATSRSGSAKAALTLAIVLGLLVVVGIALVIFGKSIFSGLFGG